MQVCTLASSSKGNALVVSCGDIHILIDAGISALRIRRGLEELGITPDMLSGILITHGHSDHVTGLHTLLKKRSIPVYATCGTEPVLRALAVMPGEQFRAIFPGEKIWLGDVEILPFATPHDADGSVGYRIQHGLDSMALVTDLGHITPEVVAGVSGVNLLVAEANHDEDWVRSGPYPYPIQRRILGDFGHLSNETGVALMVEAARSGTQAVILAHLSPENNTPAHALQIVRQGMAAAGFGHIPVTVAPEKERGEIFRIFGGKVEMLQEELLCSASI